MIAKAEMFRKRLRPHDPRTITNLLGGE